MKKIIAVSLALVLALGLFACGAPTEAPAPASEAPAAAAPAAAEAPAVAVAPAASVEALAEGESVSVKSPEEFAEVYTKLYAGDSTIKEIKLEENINLTAKDIVAESAPYPVITGKYPYLIFRMPEGIRLDLNGYLLTVRGQNGLDGRGGADFGQIVDSFGGGSITLYAYTSAEYFEASLALAEAYPELVKVIIVTNTLENTEAKDYVIPENVTLQLTGENSALTCNSLTLRPGALLKIGEKTKIGVSDTKNIIFECRSEADHSRLGIELATEIKDV